MAHAYYSIQKPFPFLELPREIRDQIYFYACGNLALCADFTVDHTVSRRYASTMSSWIRVSATKQWRLLNMKDRPCASSKYWPTALNALLVSRQVHYEAALVFYSSSIFRIRKIKDVHSLTLRIRPGLRAQIRRLELNFYSFHLRTWEYLLKFSLALQFQLLRYLKIVLFEYDKPENLRKLQDCHLGGYCPLELLILASDYKSKELRNRDEEYAKIIIEWLEGSFDR